MGTRPRLFLLSLWYFPSHFGLHVDDVARALREEYDVTIVTVARATFTHPYFDPFRDTFDDERADDASVIRLNVARFEERGAYNPHVFLRDDAALRQCTRRMREGPCRLLHYFEMLLPAFNRETIPSALSCSLMYAGNFLRRIAAQGAPPGGASVEDSASAPDAIARTLFDRSRIDSGDGTYTLRGTGEILSETKDFLGMLRATGLRAKASWVARPIFPGDIASAPPANLEALFGIPKGGCVLLYPGRPAKNARILPRVLARAQELLPDRRLFLLLIGTRPDEIADWPDAAACRACIRAHALMDRRTLHGIMKAADVLAYPGLIDGYPKVISEAGCAGLPVVAFASPASGIREMGANEEIALLIAVLSAREATPAEERAFARAIVRVLSDSPFRERLTARAREAAHRTSAHRFRERIERCWKTGASNR